jgi:hypothetical protein
VRDPDRVDLQVFRGVAFVIPAIPNQARQGVSHIPYAYEAAVRYWNQLFAPVVEDAHLVVGWLHSGSPTHRDISGSTIFSALSPKSKRGIIVDQEDGSELRDDIGWFFNTGTPTSTTSHVCKFIVSSDQPQQRLHWL